MNKAQTKRKCKELLNGRKLYNPFDDPEEIKFLMSVFEKHHRWDAKKGVGVKAITIKTVAPFGSRCFHLVRTDGTVTDISYNQCVDGKDTIKKEVLFALRRAIAIDVLAFRKTIDMSTAVCALSGAKLTDENIQIDHYDLCFNELAENFIALKGLEYLGENINNREADNITEIGFNLPEIISEFREYHNSNTHLRAVTQEANHKAEEERKKKNGK